MKISLRAQSEEVRFGIRYGVKGKCLYYIPYTGWGNTITTRLYADGQPVLEPICTDSQWAGIGDPDPDGEVFASLEEAEAYYGFPLSEKVIEVKDPAAIGGYSHKIA